MISSENRKMKDELLKELSELCKSTKYQETRVLIAVAGGDDTECSVITNMSDNDLEYVSKFIVENPEIREQSVK